MNTRNRFFLAALAFALVIGTFSMSASACHAQDVRKVRKTFGGQLAGVAADLADAVSSDRKLKGRMFAIGKITTGIPDSNFELEIVRALRNSIELKPLLSDDSDLFIQGEYNFLQTGRETEHKQLAVVEVMLKITDRFGKALQTVRREINETDDIAMMTGSTVSPPDTKEIKFRNEKVKQSFASPSFDVLNGSEIAAKDNPMYSVQILRRRNGGPATPLTPTTKRGMAFVDLAVSDTFEIVLRSYDPSCRSVGKVSIDGLSVVNTFSEDKSMSNGREIGLYAGYALNKAKSKSTPSTHTVPGWLRTTKSNKANVWQFDIKEFGKGAASAMQSKSNLGVITVQFFQAAENKNGLRGRSYGEVGKGQLMNVNYSVKQLQLLDVAECTINIRYSIPLGN